MVGFWEVIERVGWDKRKRTSFWRCRCSCGGVHIIPAKSLREGRSRSCGCGGVSKDNDRLPFGTELQLRRSSNKTGFRGVYWDDHKHGYMAALGSRQSNNYCRFGPFLIADEAARAYDKEARHRYGDKAALNFPLEGEVGVSVVQDDQTCPNGHNLLDHGYTPSRRANRKARCRKCNAEAAKRLKQRHRLLRLLDLAAAP
jgi:hypothetical protein